MGRNDVFYPKLYIYFFSRYMPLIWHKHIEARWHLYISDLDHYSVRKCCVNCLTSCHFLNWDLYKKISITSFLNNISFQGNAFPNVDLKKKRAILFRPQCFNWSRPSDVSMHHQARLSLVQIMAYHLFSATSLFVVNTPKGGLQLIEAMVAYFSEILVKIQQFWH